MPLSAYNQEIVDIRMALANHIIQRVLKNFDYNATRAMVDEIKTSINQRQKIKIHDDRISWLRDKTDRIEEKQEQNPNLFSSEKEKKDYIYSFAAAAGKKETGNCQEHAILGLDEFDKEIESLKNEIRKQIHEINMDIKSGIKTLTHIKVANQLKARLKNLNFKIAVYYIDEGDHVFLIFGNYPHDANAVVCDIWAKEAFLARDIPSRLYDFDGNARIGKRLKLYNPKTQHIALKHISDNSIQTFTRWPTQPLPLEFDHSTSIDCISVYRMAKSLNITIHSSHLTDMTHHPEEVYAAHELLVIVDEFLAYQPNDKGHERKALLDAFVQEIKTMFEQPTDISLQKFTDDLFRLDTNEMFFEKKDDTIFDNDTLDGIGSAVLSGNMSFENMYGDVNLKLDSSLIKDAYLSMNDDDSELGSKESMPGVAPIPFEKILSDIEVTMKKNNPELNYEKSLGGLKKLIVTNKATRDCFINQTLDNEFLRTIFYATSPNIYDLLCDAVRFYDLHLQSLNRNIEPQHSNDSKGIPEENTKNMNRLFYNNVPIKDKDAQPKTVVENDQSYCF